MIKALLGCGALLQMITGALPDEEKALLVELCGGGQISIPFGDDAPEDEHPCDPQACHAGTCREKTKRANLI